jgi:hypothetical protein
MNVRYSVLQMSGTTPNDVDAPPDSGDQSVPRKKFPIPISPKNFVDSLISVITMPTVVSTDSTAAPASRTLIACSPTERRVRVRVREIDPAPGRAAISVPSGKVRPYFVGAATGVAPSRLAFAFVSRSSVSGT